jgi:hypothetical protein
MRALLVGWFSFENSDSTAGDFLVCDVVREWLEEAGWQCDVALAPPFTGGVSLATAAPSDYSHAVFVCGPFMRNRLEAEFLARFADHPVIGINLTLPVPLVEWNPFDVLLERDSSEGAHPDLAFVARTSPVPVVGVCLVEPYDEAMVSVANAAVAELLATRHAATVSIDTRLDVNTTGLRSKDEIESLISRMDLLVTTRLHGTVLALKHGVPALAIDPESGGAKIKRQCATIGWPVVFTVDHLEPRALQDGFDYCLSDEARTTANACAARARALIAAARGPLIEAVKQASTSGSRRDARRAFAATHGVTS